MDSSLRLLRARPLFGTIPSLPIVVRDIREERKPREQSRAEKGEGDSWPFRQQRLRGGRQGRMQGGNVHTKKRPPSMRFLIRTPPPLGSRWYRQPLQPLRALLPTVLDLGIGLPHDMALSPPCHGLEGHSPTLSSQGEGLPTIVPKSGKRRSTSPQRRIQDRSSPSCKEGNCRSGRKSMKGNDSPKGLGEYQGALRRGARGGRPPKRSASRSFRFSSPNRGSGQLCGEGS